MKVSVLREMSRDELLEKLNGLREGLFNLKFQHATGQLENTQRLPQVRKDLARVKTLLRQKTVLPAESK